MCHKLHVFVVLLEASAKPQTCAIYGCIMHEYGIQYLTCCTLETRFRLAMLIDNHGSGYLGMARCFNVH